MDDPKTEDHQQNPATRNDASNDAGTSSSVVKDSNAAPNTETSNNPKKSAETKEKPTKKSEIREAVLSWLRTYWDKPREKSKGTDIALVILTLAAAIAAFISAWIFEGQLSAMRAANDSADKEARIAHRNARRELKVTESQLKALQGSVIAIQGQTIQQERPWISARITPAPEDSFNYTEKEGGSLLLAVKLKNIGHSVAQKVRTWGKLEMGEDYDTKINGDVCSLKNAPIETQSDFVLFPDEEPQETHIEAKVNGSDATKALKGNISRKGQRWASLTIIVCVDYKSVLDSSHHQTRRILDVVYPDAVHQLLIPAFEPDKTYRGILFQPRLQGDAAN